MYKADFDLKENRFQQEMKSCGFNKDLLSLNEAQRQVSNTRNTIDSCDKIEEEPSIPNNIKHHRYSPKYGHLFIPLPSVNVSESLCVPHLFFLNIS